ncbi:hypothetical protein Tco_1102506 [Tanacetum coccineum]
MAALSPTMITTKSLTWGGKEAPRTSQISSAIWTTLHYSPNAAGSRDLVATIDGREVVVTESLIRAQLQLDDANGIFDMQIDDIFAGMGAIGYPTDRTLTFLKHHLSPQWRFLVHTILHCLSPKAGSWNQFPSSIATALICLSTGRVYNFSRFILEGMIANVKTKKNKFLMYPRFLQMLVAIETADRTPRPTFGFTRKLFSNMKLKWEGEEIPLTPPMLAIAAAGNDAADEAAGSAAEAHPVPHSPLVSPVRELTPERQFGPEPRPAGYVDPDVLEPIIFGPQPRPSDFVDPDLEEPVIFGPPPRPDNYIEPADIDNLVSMEDDTIHGGFHEESPVGPNDAPTPTADAAGRAEDPTLLTSLSAKLDRCMGRNDLMGKNRAGNLKENHGGSYFDTCISSKEVGKNRDMAERERREEVPLRRKRSVYRRARTEFNTSAFAQFHAPLSADVLPQAAISESAGPSAAADKGKAPMPELDIPAEFLAEDAQARQRLEEEQASERLVHRLRAEDLAKEDLPNVSEERAKELDDLMMHMTETDWLNLMLQVGSNPALARELLGVDVTEANFVERMTAIKERKKRALADLRYRALKGKPLKQSEVTQMMRNLVKNQWCASFIMVFHGWKAVKFSSCWFSPPLSGLAPLLLWSNCVPDLLSPLQAAMDLLVHTVRWRVLMSFSYIVMRRADSGKHSDDEIVGPTGVEDFFQFERESDDVWMNYTPLFIWWHIKIGEDGSPSVTTRMNMRLGGEQLEVVFPKSSVHVLDLTNGKTVYMFVDKFYPIRATLLERMLRHRLTVPPSYCRDVVVAGSVIQTIQAGLRESYECLASAPIHEQTATGQRRITPLYGFCAVLPINVSSFDPVSAAGYIVSAGVYDAAVVPADSSSSVPADYVSAGHVLVPADRDRIC